MVNCARCGRDVEKLQSIPPDVISKEQIDAIEYGEQDLARKGNMEVCAECMNELRGV